MSWIYRIQTVGEHHGRKRPLGKCSDPDVAEKWRATEEAALREPVEVEEIEVDSARWAGVDPNNGKDPSS